MSRSEKRTTFLQCHCDVHQGRFVHYKARQRCESSNFQQDYLVRAHTPANRALVHSDMILESDCESDCSSDNHDTYEHDTRIMDAVQTLLLRQFATMMDHNMTEAAVTATLQAWMSTLEHWLPLELRAKVPRTCKALVGHFRHSILPIDRIPMCPAECSLLDEVRPSLTYACHCDGKANYPWRY